MNRLVYSRKRKVSTILERVKNTPASEQFTHEQMCFCYVLVYAALEFMVESTIREWVSHRLKKHNVAYKGKRSVDEMISILQRNAESNLKNNHTIEYQNMCTLVEKVAGPVNKQSFKDFLANSSPAGVNDVIARIERISITRHKLAHGVHMPADISPNISELQSDFEFLYANLIGSLDKVLPRR